MEDPTPIVVTPAMEAMVQAHWDKSVQLVLSTMTGTVDESTAAATARSIVYSMIGDFLGWPPVATPNGAAD